MQPQAPSEPAAAGRGPSHGARATVHSRAKEKPGRRAFDVRVAPPECNASCRPVSKKDPTPPVSNPGTGCDKKRLRHALRAGSFESTLF